MNCVFFKRGEISYLTHLFKFRNCIIHNQNQFNRCPNLFAKITRHEVSLAVKCTYRQISRFTMISNIFLCKIDFAYSLRNHRERFTKSVIFRFDIILRCITKCSTLIISKLHVTMWPVVSNSLIIIFNFKIK